MREFFCGPASDGDARVLQLVDEAIVRFFNEHDRNGMLDHEHLVLDAVEALFAQQRGASLDRCRTVLLVDEVSKSPNEQNVYDVVKVWIDSGFVGAQRSRRGAFFTGLTIISPWTKQSPTIGRGIVQIPLGILDVWDVNVQNAITAEARQNWPNLGAIPQRVWSLLAATGGRPRDIVAVMLYIKNHHDEADLAFADQRMLLNALLTEPPYHGAFAQYLLPSMLNLRFCAIKDNVLSSFGVAAPSPALLNADLLAREGDVVDGVPVVSLCYARSIPGGVRALSLIVNALAVSTTFCSLDGSGKDFARLGWIDAHTSALAARVACDSQC